MKYLILLAIKNTRRYKDCHIRDCGKHPVKRTEKLSPVEALRHI